MLMDTSTVLLFGFVQIIVGLLDYGLHLELLRINGVKMAYNVEE